ncbi:MAG: P2 family phage major capsid protein [Clostridia bacterium]|nr:P2 family phage major capsid protein [Clostridia bacterium]
MTTEEILALLNKAAISRATGGQLTTEQAKQFIDTVVAQSDFLQKIQTVQMTSGTYQLNTIEIASRVMRAATEGVAPSNTAGVTITPRSLTSKEVILPYDITFSFLEENIEGQNAEGKINQMFAKAFGNDNLDLATNGNESLAATITDADADGLDDTTGLSQNDHDFLTANDGWLRLARVDSTVHDYVIPADPTALGWKSVFKNMLKLMPNKWKANTDELVFLVAPDVEVSYRDELGTRNTALGDALLAEKRRASYQGIIVEPMPFMPGGNTPSVMLTKPKNLGIGIGRNIRVGRQIQERKRVIEYTITAKTDYNYVLGDMIVLGEKA